MWMIIASLRYRSLDPGAWKGHEEDVRVLELDLRPLGIADEVAQRACLSRALFAVRRPDGPDEASQPWRGFGGTCDLPPLWGAGVRADRRGAPSKAVSSGSSP